MRVSTGISKFARLLPALMVLASFLTSCHGRRASDMQPLGDTIEVVIKSQVQNDTINQTQLQENENL